MLMGKKKKRKLKWFGISGKGKKKDKDKTNKVVSDRWWRKWEKCHEGTILVFVAEYRDRILMFYGWGDSRGYDERVVDITIAATFFLCQSFKSIISFLNYIKMTKIIKDS